LIGGERVLSRGHTGQGGEREEVAIGGFQRTKTREEKIRTELVVRSFRTYLWGLIGDSHGYMWIREGKVTDVRGLEKGNS
jgi:hypothetical protein